MKKIAQILRTKGNAMLCKRYEIMLSAYLDGELSAAQEKLVASHLEQCPDCQAEMAALTKVKGACRELPTPTPCREQWEKFSDQLLEELSHRKRRIRMPRYSIWLGKAAGIVLIAVSCVVVFLFLYPKSGEESVFSLKYAEAQRNKYIDSITHTPVAVLPSTKPYKVNNELRNLARANLSQTEQEFLFQNGFVVTSRQYPSFIALYRQNQQDDIPSFISIDSTISGLAHILARLRVDLERELFYNKLLDLTAILGERLLKLHDEIPASCQEASLRALAFVSVAERLLNAKRVAWPPAIEAQIGTQVEEELKLIYNGRENRMLGIQRSPVFGYDIDYNRFKQKWDSTKEEKLKRYYQTLEWYNRCVFRSSSASETQSALLILLAAIGDSADGIMIWEEMHLLLIAIYGEPDDPHLLDYLSVARKVYGDTITPAMIDKNELLTRFSRQVARTRTPQIRSEVGLHAGLRLFGGVSYDRDLMLQQLVHPYVGQEGDPRVIPSIVDIGVILGHQEAMEVAKQGERDFFAFAKYEEQIKRYQERLQKNLSVSNPWQSGGFVAQAWLYEALMQPESKGLPLFTRTDAWHARNLTSMLCGILGLAEINSRPIFSGKAEGAFSGIVDPYPEFFNRMVTSIRNLEKVLNSVGYPMERTQGQEVLLYKKGLQSLVNISVKTLSNIPLMQEDMDQLRDFVLGWEGDYEEANINELSILVHRNEWKFDDYFYAGVEPIRELWVACPGTSAPFLARGGIYLLYGFPTGKKILPEQWRKERIWDRLGGHMVPWTKKYVKTTQH
jgi:hypothetical protein